MLQGRHDILPILVLAACAATAAHALDWTFTDPATGADIGNVAVAVDPADRPVLAYGGDALRVARWNGTGWDVETIDSTECLVVGSLAVDVSGEMVVSYGMARRDAVAAARFDGAAWHVEILQDDNGGGESSVAFDPAGRPAIAWGDPYEDDLWLARFDGVAWQVELVATGIEAVAARPSLAFAPDGSPVISHSAVDPYSLRLARWTPGGWVHETIPEGGECYTSSLAFGPGGQPAIAVHENTGRDLLYLTFDGTTWSAESVDTADTTGSEPTLRFAPDGAPTIAFRKDFDTRVRWARREASGWVVEPLGGSGARPLSRASLAVTSAGEQVAAWPRSPTGATASELHVTRGRMGAFADDMPVAGWVTGLAASVAVGASGLPHVTWLDETSDRVGYSAWDGTAWQSQLVADADGFGKPQIVLDRAGRPLIAYTMGDIMLAEWDGAAWQVARAGPRASGLSLTLDPAGEPAISANNFNRSVLILRRQAGTWTTGGVPGVTGVQGGTSIAFDAAGNQAVAFCEAPGEDLAIAWWNGPSVALQRIDTEGRVGEECHLAFGPDGRPRVSHVALLRREVRLTSWTGTAWVHEIVSGPYGPNQQAKTSVGFDAVGAPVVAFSNVQAVTRGPALSRFTGGRWEVELLDPTTASASPIAMAIDASGRVHYAYHSSCANKVRVATADIPPPSARAFRGVAIDLSPGWQDAALPLTSLNDDGTPPFPAAIAIPGTLADVPPTVPLVLYLALGPGDTSIPGDLRVTKGPAGGVLLSWN